ncbi:MAG TPA: hypothetical protein ENN07_06625 [candidate division Zixibacteria bacterium]|nr:hypothetical protein [candidate division Zixibacteria bacterium]
MSDFQKNDYWWVWTLLGRWRFIILGSIIIGALSFGIASLFPKWYKAEAEVMPSYRSSASMGAMANLVTGIMSMGGGGGDYSLPMMTTPSDLWKAVVNSNAMVDTLISEFDLDARYEIDLHEKVRKKVRKHLEANVSGEGILKISFEDKDPRFAAFVTNTVVDNLDNINRSLRSGSAGATREFIETRLEETKMTLAEAAETFAAFQKEHGAFSIEDQTRVTIENLAQLEAEIQIANVELGILSSTRKPEHGEIEDVRAKIKSLREQIEIIRTGSGTAGQIGLRDIPELAVEYARLYRELMIQEVLYEFLVQQFEQARIEELKDTPILQVLSRAQVPQKKERPKRAIILVLSVLGGGILLAMWVLGAAFLDRMKTEQPEKYQLLAESLGGHERKEK